MLRVPLRHQAGEAAAVALLALFVGRSTGPLAPCLRGHFDVIVPVGRAGRRIAMFEVSLGELRRDESKLAAGLLGRAFRDNPTVVATNRGGSPHSRLLAAQRGMGRVVAMMERLPLVARRRDWLVGVFGIAPPGTCRLPLSKSVRLMPSALLSGPGVTVRGFRMMRQWEKRDPDEPHWHVGPIGVEPALQGMSVGSQMLQRFCAEMDDRGDLAYLETDKPENVRLYERFGFVVTSEADVIGVRCWFMLREPK